MQKVLFSLFYLFLSISILEACDETMAENHTQVCENHTTDVENHNAACCSDAINIVADYHFDECLWDGTSEEVIDSSGNDRHGTAFKDAQISSGKINNSGYFSDDGTDNNYVRLNSALTDVSVDLWTISCWVKIKPDGTWQPVFFIPDSDSTRYGMMSLWYYSEDGSEGVSLWVDDHYLDSSWIDKNLSDNQWHFISVAYDGTDVNLHIDDTNNISIPYTHDSRVFSSTNNSYVGVGRNDTSFTSNMYIDEVKIYDSVLNDSNITALYNETREAMFCPNDLVADYHFDKCTWDGTLDEVLDNKIDYNATDYNGATLANGFINNSASFDGTDDLIDAGQVLNNVFGTSSDHFTVTAWIKPLDFDTTSTNHLTKNVFFSKTKINTDGSNNDNIEFGVDENGKLHIYIDTIDVDTQADYDTSISLNSWTFVSVTYNQSIVTVRVNDTIFKDTTTWSNGKNIDSAGDSFVTIGASRHGDDNFIGNYFTGQIDEVKIFKSALTESQTLAIYENESNHKNYDGTHRMAVDCTSPLLLAEYRFDECTYDGSAGEVIDSENMDNNGTIMGTATIDKSVKKIGHAIHLSDGAVTIDDLDISVEQYKKYTVMFWMYWDGSSNVMPFGWSSYDLWVNGTTYFGFNAGSSLSYGIETTGLQDSWHHVAAVFTNGDVYSNQLYIDGVRQNISHLYGTLNNDNAYASSSAKIGGWRTNDSYQFGGNIDELKIYKGELDQASIEADFNSAITRDIICSQAIFNAVNANGGCFNWDNNITTKVAGGDFNITILSADANDDNNSLQDTNITKLEILNFSDATCSTLNSVKEIWSGNKAVDSNGCYIQEYLFTYLKATKCARFRITGIYDGKSVESNSTDTFSIRPDKFVLENIPVGKLISERDYTCIAKAVLPDGATVVEDYNTSITPTNKKYFRDGSDGSGMDGIFIPTAAFSFSDGTTPNTILSFDNVGKIGLELNDTTWTEVDADDTSLVDRTIYLEHNLSFIPAKFDINFTTPPSMSNYNNGLFTYFAQDAVQMGAKVKDLSFKVTALGEKGGIMTNYQNPQETYFANNSDFFLALDVEKNPTITPDINESQTKDINFTSGVATLTYVDVDFNFGRERNVTKNPLLTDGSNSNINISVIDAIDNEVNGSKIQTLNGNATFYYGRVRTKDVKTAQTLVDANQMVQIYSTNPLAGFQQISSSWYLNKLDSFSHLQEREENRRKLTAITVNDSIVANGRNGFSIVANPTDKSYRKFYQLDISSWLWYSRYEDYNFTVDATCAQHPCFEYSYDSPNDGVGIQSGDFNGTKFDNNFTSNIKRKAIKMMR